MRRVLVWGLGRSGRSALELLAKKGIEAVGGDDARGDRWEEYIDSVDIVVLSPGVAPSHPLWREARRRDIEVIGELELAYRFFKGKVVAITGTDGKSTTTKLTCMMLQTLTDAQEAGNIGTPFSELVLKEPTTTAVVEVSSFQGKTLKTFRPQVGVFTNFSPDHLDWHPNLEDYLRSKFNIFKNQTRTDYFLSDSTQKEAYTTPTRAQRIDIVRDVERKGDAFYFRGELLFRIGDLKLRGEHNLKNALFASITAKLMGVPAQNIRETLSRFRGLPYRMELVATFGGVEIYNDSKSTTPNSLRAALESFPDNSVILIAGGKDKGADFSHLRELAQRKIKYAFLIGETKKAIKTAFGGGSNIKECSSLEEAVSSALGCARPGDFVLFSPGCSSFDMFSSYVERGETFNKLVKAFVNY